MLKFKIALVLFVLEKNYGDSKIKVFIVVCFFNTKMLTVRKRKKRKEELLIIYLRMRKTLNYATFTIVIICI